MTALPETQSPTETMRDLAAWTDHMSAWLHFHVDGPTDEDEPEMKTRMFPAADLDELTLGMKRIGRVLRHLAGEIDAAALPPREPAKLIAFPGGRSAP